MQSCAFEFTFSLCGILRPNTKQAGFSHFFEAGSGVSGSRTVHTSAWLQRFFRGDESDNLLSSHSQTVLASLATQTPLESEMRVCLPVSASQHAKAFCLMIELLF